MTFGKPGKRRARFLLVALAAGIVVLAGSLSATGASAATASTVTTVVTHQKAPASNHVIFPSYYVTPAGKRLSVAQADADAATPAAAAASLPVYYIPSGDSGELSGIHACEELGSHNGTEGVECADLWAEGESGYVYVSPFGEGYCQNSSGYPQCANITFKFLVADAVAPGSARVAVSETGTAGIVTGHVLAAAVTTSSAIPQSAQTPVTQKQATATNSGPLSCRVPPSSCPAT